MTYINKIHNHNKNSQSLQDTVQKKSQNPRDAAHKACRAYEMKSTEPTEFRCSYRAHKMQPMRWNLRDETHRAHEMKPIEPIR